VRATAQEDGYFCPVWMESEPGSSGKAIIDHYLRFVLPGFTFHGERSTGSKVDRAQPVAAMAEGGHMKLGQGDWNKAFRDELESVPGGQHDDQCDALSLAFRKLAGGITEWTLDVAERPSEGGSLLANVPEGVFLEEEAKPRWMD